jgi:hemoglobin/transferrin/lactoferrin receptor protein
MNIACERKVIWRALTLMAILPAAPTLAGEKDPTASEGPELETVLVTATRLETDLSKTTRSIAFVDSDKIETIQPRSVAQALAYEPNITISGGPRALNQTVNIRGLEGSKVVQTVDGARQNFESGHRPSFFLDPELLQSVEAMRGPASSLWGSGALGGVVAQNTIRANHMLEPRETFGGFVKTGYNDNNEESTTTLALVGRTRSSDWLLSGYYRDSEDLELGNGDDLPGSAAESKGVLAKWNLQLSDKQELAFNFRTADVDGTIPANGAAEINDTSNFLIERDQTTYNASVGYSLTSDSPWVDASVLAYYNGTEMEEQRAVDGRADETDLDVYGLNLANVVELGDTRLQFGFDSYREEFDASRGGSDRPEPPEAQSTVWSVYAQAMVPLAESWRMEVALRYDDFETEADNLSSQRSDNETSPSVALVWDAADWATFTLRHDRAFRAPGAEELYSSGTHFCLFPGFCNTFAPNPELEPEEAANTELITRLNFVDAVGADAISVEMSVFHNEVDDFIEQVVDGPHFFPELDAGTTSWFNVDEATIEGFELSAGYFLNNFSARLSYGLTRGEDDNTNDDLTNIPADTLKADISYGFLDQTLLTGVRVTHANEQDRTDYPENVSGTEYDDYTVTDLYISWQPQWVPGVRLDLNVNNVTDKYYRRAWEELYEAGREVILTARYSF